jgi:hypothetical protein
MMLASLAQMLNSSAFGAGAGDSSAYGSLFGGSALGSFMGGRKAKKDKRKMQQRLKRALSATESIQGKGLQQQEALSRLATQQQLGGYDTARREASRLGRTAKREAIDRGTQLEARASQNLANRGLGSTTAGANLSRGISSDVSRTNAGIDEGLAGLFGDLALGRSGVEAQGTANLANIAGQQTDLQSQLAQMRLLGGGTLGNFNAGSFQAPGAGWQTGFNEGMGSLFGGMGGGNDGNAQLMQMLQQLFSQGGMGG